MSRLGSSCVSMSGKERRDEKWLIWYQEFIVSFCAVADFDFCCVVNIFFFYTDYIFFIYLFSYPFIFYPSILEKIGKFSDAQKLSLSLFIALSRPRCCFHTVCDTVSPLYHSCSSASIFHALSLTHTLLHTCSPALCQTHTHLTHTHTHTNAHKQARCMGRFYTVKALSSYSKCSLSVKYEEVKKTTFLLLHRN